MAQPIVINSPVPGNTVIAAAQSPAANVAFTLNNTDPYGKAIDPFFAQNSQSHYLPNFVSPITLYSGGNDSAINYTITGLDINQNPLSETKAGPNNGNTSTTGLFSVVFSIKGNANTTSALSVGILGDDIVSMPISLDVFRTNSQLVSIGVQVTGTITYTVDGAVQKPILGFGSGSMFNGTNSSAVINNTNILWQAIPTLTNKNASLIEAEDIFYSALQLTCNGTGNLSWYIYQGGLV